uniref:HEAT repeat-containing protein 6 n=1 Tax=Culicoides sonorensis TaxID=179676 RepID=A0A336LVX6_CULSO
MDAFQCLKEILMNYSPQYKQELHVLLNEVNSAESYRYMPVTEITLIIQLITQLNDLDEALYCKLFLLLNKILSSSKPNLTGKSASNCQNWIFHALIRNNGIKLEGFKSLSIVLKYSDNISPDVLNGVCSVENNFTLNFFEKCSLNKNLETDSDSQDTLISCIRCIEIISYKSTELTEIQINGITKIAEILITILSNVTPSKFGSKYFAFASGCLNVFNHVLRFSPAWIENGDNLQFILGCFKSFVTQDDSKPTKAILTLLMVPDGQPLVHDSHGSNKKKKKPCVTNKANKKPLENNQFRPQLLAPAFMIRHSSDSEHSDTESPQSHTRQRLKANMLTLLLTMCQVTDKSKLITNWYTFFGEHPSISLLSVMKTDTSAKCRSMALQTASIIIFKVRQYLQHAELGENSPYSFTPYTVSLGISMKYIYETLNEILGKESHITVITQILKCLCTLISATTYNHVMIPIIKKYLNHTRQLLKHKDLTIRVACLSVIEAFLGSNGITKALYGITQHVNTFLLNNSDAYPLSEAYYNFWNEILTSTVTELQNLENTSSVRCNICDTFAFIECIYDRLSREKQLFFISLITGTSFDEDFLVKASSIRCLAIMAHFPILNEDAGFIDNTLELTKHMFCESNVQGKIKSSWCLSHISDVLVESSEIEMPDITIISLLELCSRNAKENEKVRVNLIRCIGNLLRLVNENQVKSDENLKIIGNAITMIEMNILSHESMKLKWNSCYAAQNLIKNSRIFNERNLLNWQEKILVTLVKTIQESKNFKVKINAISALRRVESKASYGQFFLKIWALLVQVLIETSNLINYSEYMYKDSLEEQVCLSICHVIPMMEKDDLINASMSLHPVSDIINSIWRSIVTKISPEECLEVNRMRSYLENMRKSDLIGEAKAAFNVFEFCFLLEQETTENGFK